MSISMCIHGVDIPRSAHFASMRKKNQGYLLTPFVCEEMIRMSRSTNVVPSPENAQTWILNKQSTRV
jgi:hypothetical protein